MNFKKLALGAVAAVALMAALQCEMAAAGRPAMPAHRLDLLLPDALKRSCAVAPPPSPTTLNALPPAVASPQAVSQRVCRLSAAVILRRPVDRQLARAETD